MFQQCILVFCCVLGIISGAKKDYVDDYDDNDDFIPFTGERFDRFDWTLCTALDEEEPGNVIASPISVKLLLAMLYEASTGETARELEKALQLSTSKMASRARHNALLRSLQEPNKNYDLEIGIRLYLDKRLSAKNWYKRILSLYYNAYVEKVDFSNTEKAVNIINDWAKTVTHGHIKNLVADADSLSQSILLLVNAVYFQGQWKIPFPVENNYQGLFTTPSGDENVQFMTQTGLFYFSESIELDSKVLRLPYKGKKFAMYIILPNSKDGLNHLLTRIQPFVLRRQIFQLEETSVKVTLPKFRFDYTMNLRSILQDIGITSIFKNEFDFHGVFPQKGDRNLIVSDIIQKASIEVTETGTVAAAASELDFVNKLDIPELEFNASHPFIFFIEDELTGTVIFEGKLVSPGVTSSTLDRPSFADLGKAGDIKVTNFTSSTRIDEHNHVKKGNLDGSLYELSHTP